MFNHIFRLSNYSDVQAKIIMNMQRVNKKYSGKYMILYLNFTYNEDLIFKIIELFSKKPACLLPRILYKFKKSRKPNDIYVYPGAPILM